MRNGDFSVASFTATGVLHRWEGTEGQDSSLEQSSNQLLGVAVCDGLSSRPLSKTGSSILSHALGRLLRDNAQCLGEQSTLRSTPSFGSLVCAWLDQELARELGIAASFLARCEATEEDYEHLHRYLYTTLLGAIITPDHTVVFGCGDGVLSINGNCFRVASQDRNRPDIVAARLLGQKHSASGELRLLWSGPTTSLDSLVLGTDGTAEVLASRALVHSMSIPSCVRFINERSVAPAAYSTRPRDDASFVIVRRKNSRTHST